MTTDYKDSKWVAVIIALQKDDGSWGYFHSLAYPIKSNPITTEQAIRRLEILGYTIKDEPIMKAVAYLHDCLRGRKQSPTGGRNFIIGRSPTPLCSTWIRRFTTDDEAANATGKKWAEIISYAFANGVYDHDRYVEVYREVR